MTNSRLRDCHARLGTNYLNVLAELQTYASNQTRHPDLDARIAARAILRNYDAFVSVVGIEETLNFLSRLGLQEEEVRSSTAREM